MCGLTRASSSGWFLPWGLVDVDMAFLRLASGTDSTFSPRQRSRDRYSARSRKWQLGPWAPVCRDLIRARRLGWFLPWDSFEKRKRILMVTTTPNAGPHAYIGEQYWLAATASGSPHGKTRDADWSHGILCRRRFSDCGVFFDGAHNNREKGLLLYFSTDRYTFRLTV